MQHRTRHCSVCVMYDTTPQRSARHCVVGCIISLQGSFLLAPWCLRWKSSSFLCVFSIPHRCYESSLSRDLIVDHPESGLAGWNVLLQACRSSARCPKPCLQFSHLLVAMNTVSLQFFPSRLCFGLCGVPVFSFSCLVSAPWTICFHFLRSWSVHPVVFVFVLILRPRWVMFFRNI